MTIRRFVASDAPMVCEIYYRSVHEVASSAYTPEQIPAWAPAVPDPGRWLSKLLEYTTYFAEDDRAVVVAWVAMTDRGYIDMLFCAPEAVGKGFAAALYAAIEGEAVTRRIHRLTAHASLLAQPFFAKRGWVIDQHEDVVRNGVALPRAAMSKVFSA